MRRVLKSIGQFVITNPEMPPEALGDKFCRLDINMTVDGRQVDLEVRGTFALRARLRSEEPKGVNPLFFTVICSPQSLLRRP